MHIDLSEARASFTQRRVCCTVPPGVAVKAAQCPYAWLWAKSTLMMPEEPHGHTRASTLTEIVDITRARWCADPGMAIILDIDRVHVVSQRNLSKGMSLEDLDDANHPADGVM